MAIQGIISGFADPANLKSNIILVGRGAHYVLLKNGEQLESHAELEQAQFAFRTCAEKNCAPDWVLVTGLSTPSIGLSTVTDTGRYKYSDYLAYPLPGMDT